MKGIPRGLILQAATTFLGKDNFKEGQTSWNHTLNYWFRASNSKFATDVASRINQNYEKAHRESPTIFSQVTNLKLLQLGLSIKETDGEIPKSEEQIEIDLFKIYLLLNHTNAERYLPGKDYIYKTYLSPEIPPVLLLSMGFSVSEIINFNFHKELYCQSVKAFLLFSFLVSNPNFTFISEIFCEYYGVENLKQYYGALLPLIQSIALKDKDGFFEFNVIKDDNYERNNRFISKLAIEKYNSEDDLDYREIRSQPFIVVSPDKYRVTHPVFFSDKIFKSVFFVLSKLNSERPPELRIKEFRSFYGLQFSEKFLFYEIMKYMLENKYLQFSGAKLDEMGIAGAPDYYIRDANTVFLFENKDVLINANVKENGSFEELETEFRKKFINDGKHPKAIKQLINNIVSIIDGKATFDAKLKVKHLKIYPIIVVHDIMFDTPGFNYFLNLWFSREIEDLKNSGKSLPVIKPLIILNIDTLILFSDCVKNNKVSLKTIFDEFLLKIRLPTKKHYKSFEDHKSKIVETYMPANYHIDNWLKKEFPRCYPGRTLLEYAFEMFDGLIENKNGMSKSAINQETPEK